MSNKSEKEKFIMKLIYNQKLMDDYDTLDLIDLENKIYIDMNDDEKIKYEMNNINDVEYRYDDYKVILIGRSIEEELISLLKKYETVKDEKLLKQIKKLISSLQILENKDYAFYSDVKDFNQSFYNYISDVIDNNKVLKKKEKGIK